MKDKLDGAELHYLYTFFECGGIVVLDPTRSNLDELNTRKSNLKQANRFLEEGSANMIKEAVDLGRAGLTKSIASLPVVGSFFTLKDMENCFIAGGKLARNIENPSFDEFINTLKIKKKW